MGSNSTRHGMAVIQIMCFPLIPLQIAEKMQLAPEAALVRNRGSPKDDRTPEKARVELPNSGQVKRAGEGTIRMDMSLLSCRVCYHPVKPPVFQVNFFLEECSNNFLFHSAEV
jgi:hypothetical protein